MLIFPIENKPDWARPPLVTLGLILVNVLVFMLYQGNDREVIEEAIAIYERHDLLAIEKDYYFDYLETKDPDTYRDLRSIEGSDVSDAYLMGSILFDREFDRYLTDLWQREAIPPSEATHEWRYQRDNFERQRNHLSAIKGGMTPAESQPLTFVTSLFLHGGWDHLLGNMAFLFLFGFTLETVLRTHTYLLMYVVSGLAANFLHLALNQGSFVPVIGASGAISGLMGMYLALYRLRKIRFFYTVFFYFGEFRAPALFILPLWLAKELYGNYFTETNIAYWAHIGGLLAGALLMLLAQNSHRQFSRELQTKDEDDLLNDKLKRIRLLMAHMDFDKAKRQTRQLCEQYPGDPRPWRFEFDLYKSQPQQKVFHEVTFALLKQFVTETAAYKPWHTDVEEILAQYQKLHPQAPALNGPLSLALARKYWRNGAQGASEAFLQRALKKGVNNNTMIALLTDMNRYYLERKQTAKATRTATQLKQLQAAMSPAPVRPAD